MELKILVMAIYTLVIVVVGIAGLRKVKSFADFFLAGRNVGPWLTAFTYGATYFSAVLFIGFAGKIGWGFGYSGLWIALGNSFVGTLLVWWLLGSKIRHASLHYQVATMPEFFEKRYGSRFLKLLSSLAIFIFFVPYSAAVFIGLAYLFKANFGLEFWHALVFMGLFTAFYIVLGGYKSMAMIDSIFGMIMTVGCLVLLAFLAAKGGGLSGLTAGLNQVDPKLTAVVGPPGFWPLFCLVFLTSVAPFAMPQLIQKFYAIRDDRSIRLGMIASTVFAVLVTGTAYFNGAVTRLFVSPTANPGAFADGKPVFDALVPELVARVVPGSLSIIILLLILSASMSTLAALVLLSSSSVAKDLYGGFINPKATDFKLTMLMRVLNAVFVFLSVILAYFRPATIVSILAISWGAIGSVFLGPFVWGVISKRMTKAGAIASAVLGLGTCVGLSLSGFSAPEAGTIGMLVSLAVNPLVSLLIRPAAAQ